MVYFSLRNTAFFSDIHIAVAIASKRFGHMVTSRVSTTAVVSTLSSMTFLPYVCRRPKLFLHELMQSSTQMSDISHTKSFIWPKLREPYADHFIHYLRQQCRPLFVNLIAEVLFTLNKPSLSESPLQCQRSSQNHAILTYLKWCVI